MSGLAVIAAAGSAYYFDLIPIADVKKDVVQKKEKSKPEGNRVTEINFPLVDVINRPLQVVPSVEHTPAGHRVSVDHLNSVWYGYVRPPGDEREKDQEPISVLTAKKEEDTLDISSTSSLAIAIEEFDCGSKKLTAQDLPSVVIPVNLDEGYLRDLDKLNETQLRVRIGKSHLIHDYIYHLFLVILTTFLLALLTRKCNLRQNWVKGPNGKHYD